MTFKEIPYERPDLEALKKAFAESTERLASAQSCAEAKAAIQESGKLMKHFMTLATIVEIRHTIDTRDAFYEAEQEFFDTESPTMSPLTMKYYETLLASPYRPELEKEFGTQLFALAEIQTKSFCDALVPLMIEENKLTSEYQKLVASAEVQLDGETYNLSGLEKLMRSPDREMRRKGYRAYAGFFAENEAKFDTIYDKLVHIRDEKGKKLGFDNFIPLGYLQMGRQGYDQTDVASFREQVRRELVPVCTRLREQQAKRIGVDKLRCYDENFQYPDGNATPIGDRAFMVEQAGAMYDALSKETGEYFRFMREHELMDLETKPGKAAGGYCTMLPDYDFPFIFSNFNGTSDDVDVLTHEAGHAFQAYTTNKLQTVPEYGFPSSEAAEIHSMSMEFFAYPWMDRFFGDQQMKYKKLHTSEALTFVPYGVCVDEFQHRVYEKPDMTPDERKAVWYELEQKYLPTRDYDGAEIFEKGAFFFQKLHIFMYPFYYVDYTLASMAAFEFYGKMQQDREAAWADYYRLCCLGGSLRYLDLLEAAHLSNPFREGSVRKAIEPLVRFVES